MQSTPHTIPHPANVYIRHRAAMQDWRVRVHAVRLHLFLFMCCDLRYSEKSGSLRFLLFFLLHVTHGSKPIPQMLRSALLFELLLADMLFSKNGPTNPTINLAKEKQVANKLNESHDSRKWSGKQTPFREGSMCEFEQLFITGP